MTLHAKVDGEGLDGRYLSINPLLGDESMTVPKHRLPDGPMMPDMAYEIRSMDANFPEMELAVCALIRGAAERVRRERLEVRPGRGVLTLEPDGDLLHVPIFSYLNGELLGAAVSRGVLDHRFEAYVDSVVSFASPYLESPELVEPLGSSGSYRTTEREIVESLPDPGTSLTREQGLSLV